VPTALELTREEWQPYIDAVRNRSAPPKLTPPEQQKREQLLARVREVAVQLKARFGVQQVILFGSLANADWFAPDSDVDIAVKGLAAADFWQAWRLAEDIIKDRPVDLIEVETAKASLRQAIQQYGIEL
jgi:predicted nucleotidyltransferase